VNAPLRTGQLGEREVGLQRQLLRSRPLRISELAAFVTLVNLGLPLVFRSWTLFLALVVLSLVGCILMLAPNIYQAGRYQAGRS
jgi:hypothetical protein